MITLENVDKSNDYKMEGNYYEIKKGKIFK